MDIQKPFPLVPTSLAEARRLTDIAVSALPALTIFGLDSRARTGHRDQQELYSDSALKMTAHCCDWARLQMLHKPSPGYWVRRSFNHRLTSHGLALAVRAWVGEFVHDGCFIVAAVGMRLEFETRDFDSNVAIVLQVRSERQVA